MQTPTPADLVIIPRDRRFDRNDRRERYWIGGDPYASALFNALSVTFPKGEAFFIDSVRKFRDGTPPRLEQDIQAFIKQEVVHSREHVAFNRQTEAMGYDLSRLDARVNEMLAIAHGRPDIVNLAATMALEHFTAIFAHQLIGNPRHLQDAEPEMRRLWQWHAMEEIEHKSVAYDTWLHATRHWSRWMRWSVKSRVMLKVTRNFIHHRIEGAYILLGQDGHRGIATFCRLLWTAFGNPGMFRKIMVAWGAYFLPGFHPWNHDDRQLITQAERDQLPTA